MKKGFTLIFVMLVLVALGIIVLKIKPALELKINKAKDNRALAVLQKIRKKSNLNLIVGENFPISLGELLDQLDLDNEILKIIAYGEHGGRYSKPGDEGNNAVILVGKSSLKIDDESLMLDTIHRGEKIDHDPYVIKIRVSDDRKRIEIVDSGMNSIGKEWSDY